MSDAPKKRRYISLVNHATGYRRTLDEGDGMGDKHTENQGLDRWVDRWGTIILWVFGGLGAVAIGFFVWFLLLLWAGPLLGRLP
jgi:hypothetical protein